jgi:NAD+ kinase
MADVVLVAHHDRLEAAALAQQAAEWLSARGHSTWMPADDAAALSLPTLSSDRRPGSADLMVSLGGDGTMLRAVSLLAGSAVPIIGVNVGLLGYLSEVEPPALDATLDRYFAGEDRGEWTVEERMLLDISVRRSCAGEAGTPSGGERWTALNEGVIEKQEPGHTVRLLVHIDGAPFTSYAADGLIIATPTGSTAYSLSARGPVVSPTHRAVLLTPVSPHMLFDRSLVLDPQEPVDVEVIGHRSATLSVDGRHAADLGEGDTVCVRPSPHVARFVRFGRRRFHQILKAKFGLADR